MTSHSVTFFEFNPSSADLLNDSRRLLCDGMIKEDYLYMRGVGEKMLKFAKERVNVGPSG